MFPGDGTSVRGAARQTLGSGQGLTLSKDMQLSIFSFQSWENNLVFYGINIMKDEEHNPDLITGRVTKSQ